MVGSRSSWLDPNNPFPKYLDLHTLWMDKNPNYLMILALGPFNEQMGENTPFISKVDKGRVLEFD